MDLVNNILPLHISFNLYLTVIYIFKIISYRYTYYFDILNGPGALRVPNIPKQFVNTPFQGKVMHSAEWNTGIHQYISLSLSPQ